MKGFETEYARKKRQEHIIWFIQNYPDGQITGIVDCSLEPVFDGKAYYEAEKLWLKQITTVSKKNAAIFGNAARFFFPYNQKAAEDLLKKARTLEPKNPKWSILLSYLYSLGVSGSQSSESKMEAAVKSLRQMEEALHSTTEEIYKFYLLPDLAVFAFEAGDVKKSSKYARESLEMAPQHKNNWNYGNAIHHGNLTLGRIALMSGELEEAGKFLLEAGRTPGSPQLDYFGPNMSLAKELLEKGERSVVLKYFQLCGYFWEMGTDELKSWTSLVEKGEKPDFNTN